MEDRTKYQCGSPSRDKFKQRHKMIHKHLFACDIDFVFIEKVPVPDIVAAVDFKTDWDDITFSEVIAYNALIRRGIPVYIVSGDADTGAFDIHQYVGGHHVKPTTKLTFVSSVESWEDFEIWEFGIRDEYKERYSSQ